VTHHKKKEKLYKTMSRFFSRNLAAQKRTGNIFKAQRESQKSMKNILCPAKLCYRNEGEKDSETNQSCMTFSNFPVRILKEDGCSGSQL
jgi:hypothetical protein